jgi:uncharacterized phage protein (TIGR02220 family)
LKIRPRKWADFQHYKDRDPAWIKLHLRLLDDYEFHCLPIASKALAPLLWLIAAGHPEGEIDADPEKLAFRLRWASASILEALTPLIEKGFFEVASGSLADCKQPAIPENIKQRIYTREETPLVRLAPDGERNVKQLRKAEALQLLEFLNGKARKHFRPVAANLSFIEARLAEGISLQDLKTLTVRKCGEWLGTDQEKYLRPETLYNATKCHSYLGEIPPEDRSCNVPDAIEVSSPSPNPAPADGARQKLESLALH